MSKYVSTFRLAFFTLLLYVWTAETIQFPGEKQGEAKKDFVIREFNSIVDTKFPNTPLVDFFQGLLAKALGAVIDWLVAKLKAEGSMDQLQKELAGFFS